MSKIQSIILSGGRSCFVKCRGCYNFFGKNTDIITNDIILSFLAKLTNSAIKKITIGGGDPLSRPDLLPLLNGIKDLGFDIYLDTVGTAFLGDARTIFYGIKDVKGLDTMTLSGLVDLIGIPLDGSNQEICQMFRTGRPTLYDDQLRILSKLNTSGLKVCINSVVHKGNANDLINIHNIIKKYVCVVEWQVFQFMPIGPLGYSNRDEFYIEDSDYQHAVATLLAHTQEHGTKIKINPKSRVARKKRYLMIDTDGAAWSPQLSESKEWDRNFDENSDRRIVGNITQPETHDAVISFVLNG